LAGPPFPPALENRIREALNEPGRTDGVRKIAERFGANPGTAQRISRPFEASVGALGQASAREVTAAELSGDMFDDRRRLMGCMGGLSHCRPSGLLSCCALQK
jgi:hypothetical protein